MLHKILLFLHQVPFWAWVILPATLVAIISYAITRNKRTSIKFAAIAIAAALLAAGFHLWEVYLSNHFIGSYDIQGLPYYFSRSGWHFFIAAWPLWFIPTALVIAIFGTIDYLLRKHHQEELEEYIMADMPEGTTATTITDKLERMQLKKKVAASEKKIKLMKGKKAQKHQHQDDLEIELKEVEKQNEQLHKELAELAEELTKAKAFIEKYMDEK